jgi:hypothetical protein
MNPHTIPNVAIATFGGGGRGLIRIAFPALYSQNCNVQLSGDHKAAVYNGGILPALRECCPEDAQNWPPSYQDAMFRAKNKSGSFQHGNRAFSQWEVSEFSESLTRNLQQRYQWARDLIYMIQVKGVKEANRHNPNPHDAEVSLQRFLSDFDTSSGSWFVDVGLEISERGKSYQWRSDSHHVVFREALDLSEATAAAVSRRSNRAYFRDISSHLLDLAGCRVDLIPRFKGPHQIEYIQMYTTDKAIVHHLEKGRHTKYMSGPEALSGQPPKFIVELYQAFYNARDVLDCAARIELRVPLEASTEVLLGLSDQLLAQCLVVFPIRTWW